MATIIAGKRDYKKGYHRNISAYKELTERNIYSKRLLLFYSIECGLKYLLLEKWGVIDVNQIEKDSERGKILFSHNLKGILKELGYQGMMKFPVLKTIHNNKVDAMEYHQIWRYGISITSDDSEKEKSIEQDLNSIADWILERV